MKRTIRVPFFEVGVKNYIYGDAVLELALAAERAAEKYDIDVLFTVPYTEIYRVAQSTQRLILLAPYMDLLRPGRGMADVLPEAVKAAGAHGVVLNHSEKPMPIAAVRKAIERARELEMLSFVCADAIVDAQALALFNPDIINPEPSDLIGTGNASDMSYVKKSIEAIRKVNPSIFVEQAAGITTAQQVYDFILAGSDAAGSASGIVFAENPLTLLDDMVFHVRKAADDLKGKGKK